LWRIDDQGFVANILKLYDILNGTAIAMVKVRNPWIQVGQKTVPKTPQSQQKRSHHGYS
jgi:hypothetical protein